MATGFNSIDEIKAANEARGDSWFSPDGRAPSDATVESEVIGGYYFVESHYRRRNDPASGRRYCGVAVSTDGELAYLPGSLGSGRDDFTSVDEVREFIADLMTTEARRW